MLIVLKAASSLSYCVRQDLKMLRFYKLPALARQCVVRVSQATADQAADQAADLAAEVRGLEPMLLDHRCDHCVW